MAVVENDTAAVALSESCLEVDEADSAPYTVRLASLPSVATVTVAIARSAGSSDVTALPAELTFTASDWSTPRPSS